MANNPVSMSKFLPSKLICIGSRRSRTDNHSASSTTTLKDCRYKIQCEGIFCNSSFPTFEDVNHKITGKGINMAIPGRGGRREKLEKKPFKDSPPSNSIHPPNASKMMRKTLV